MNRPKPVEGIIFGSSASMAAVPNGGADLIVTGPPYFPVALEPLLRAPRAEQLHHADVQAELTAYALSLRPVFAECARVLRPGRVMCVQTKDIRYGGRLLTLAAIHRDVLESCGLYLLTRFFWLNTRPSWIHGTHAARLDRGRYRGGLLPPDVEEVLVVCDAAGVEAGAAVETSDAELEHAASPLWRLPGPGGQRHPYASPSGLVRRLVLFFSDPDDLVLDPFAGSGTTLRVARRLGRRAIGYEIDPNFADTSVTLGAEEENDWGD
jgi:modification methylase